ncbi:TIR domain-containing protein [Clavibacter michiganensis subsp. michiganensis]|uniref:TIR domain-containing protein n=1 Tax=Clavibacter michiganensis TaxID=28447 RepID=UPI001FF212FA|nr:TIR domain-containing protein [Clavibacter michiganensis]UOW03102.1 TIR domain-containing protein [Clavibacter michiganensis subsp. michiganensis]
MAQPRAFLSFDFDHNATARTLFAGQAAKESPTSFSIEDWSSKSSLPQSQWEALIKDKISRTHMLIVLVGKSMGSATGVDKEIAMAKAANVPVFGVYVDGASGSSTLPAGLPRTRVIPWTWTGVGSAITQMMGEGKNAA